MKNLQNSIKEKLLAKYLVKDSSDNIDTKSTDINILLNRVKTNQKNESRRKIIFFCSSINRLALFGLIIF